jgi:hypothetical protein
VALLGDVLEELRDLASVPGRELAAELPASAGFHPATLAAGLELGFAPWTREALAEVVARELEAGPPGRSASGFPVTSVLLGGAIPMPSVLQIVAPLALGSPVLVRPGSHDPVTARALARALARRDAGLGAALEVVAFPHDDETALAAFAEADCVVATGSDAAVAAVRECVRPWQRFVGYGHRFSLAALGRAGDAAAPCAALARDVALWDQLGCLSPIALYAVGWRWEERAELLAHLENAFAQIEKRWPIGQIGLVEGAAREHELATLELRAVGDGDVELRRGNGRPSAWALAAERDPTLRGSPLHRVLRVHFVPTPAALAAAIGPAACHLASVGMGGFGAPDARALATAATDLGASRVCPLGEMQTPPLGWCHDGQGVLLPLARLADSAPK